MKRLLPALLVVALWATTASAIEFADHARIPQRRPVDCAMLGDRTVYKCADGLWLVDWSRPGAARDSLLAARDLPTEGYRAPLVAWGDSLVALAPEGEGGHLIVHLDSAGRPVVETVDDPGWLPDQTWLGGRPWFVDASDGGFRLLPALAAGGDTVVVDPSTHYEPGLAAFAGDRVVLVRHGFPYSTMPAVIRVWDLSDPEAPVSGPETETVIALYALVFHDGLLFLGGADLQAWDVSDVQQPVLLGQHARHELRRLAFGPDGRLAAYGYGGNLWIIDVSNPALMRTTVSYHIEQSYTPSGGLAFGTDTIALGDDRQARGFALPTWSGGAMRDLGTGWPVISYEGRAATDGANVWIQDRWRLVAEPGARTLLACPEAALGRGGEVCRFLAWHRGHLLSLPGDGRLVSEDVSDPRHPRTVWEYAAAFDVTDAVLAGDQLAVTVGAYVVIFDVRDPAAPRARGAVAIGTADRTRVGLLDDLLVVAQGTSDHAIPVPNYADTVRVFAIGRDGPFPLLAAAPFVFEDGAEFAERCALAGVAAFAGDVYLYAYDYGIADSPRLTAVRLDLTDPVVPTVRDPSWPTVDPNARGVALATGRFGTYEVAPRLFDGDFVVRRYEGVEPSNGPILGSVQLPEVLAAAAGSNGHVAAVTYEGVDTWFLDGIGFESAVDGGVPSVPGGAVAAVPNPFNPRTTFRFAVDLAGPVRVDVFDLAGRRVRTLTAELPVGPAALPWDGRDDDGRAVASGVYLVRAEAGGAPQRGRCVLLR